MRRMKTGNDLQENKKSVDIMRKVFFELVEQNNGVVDEKTLARDFAFTVSDAIQPFQLDKEKLIKLIGEYFLK